MVKRKKILSAIVATMVLTGALVGCGGSSSKESSAKELKVWSRLTEQEVAEIKPLAEKWGEENGVKVTIAIDKSKTQEAVQAINAGKGPDLMFGIPHDNIGLFEKAGLLEELPKDLVKDSDFSSKQVMDAVTVNGKRYALPIAQETVALFYNKDKAKEAPKTMEEVVKKGKDVGFKFDINNFYNSYGFIAANGGYVFKDTNGTLDPKDIGLDNEGAIKGYQFIQDLVQKDKLMPADIKGDMAKGDFTNNKIGYYISGPWDVASFKEAGVNFGVAPMPTLDGKKVPTFMGVQTAFVSAKSENKDLAWKLGKYLLDNSEKVLLDKGNRIPVLKSALESKDFKDNKYMSAFAEQAKNATPMPNIPEVQAMWQPAGANLILLTSGKITPQECGKLMNDQIKQGIEQQK
ncbi:MAG: maltose ABC transporter substrate-binding protein [Clostridium sp.]|uniref:sugar ABC transporter substrate-binding protein n=1 Tax=Clostridium sp. TaxID=1506 RepID=UPI003F2ACE79